MNKKIIITPKSYSTLQKKISFLEKTKTEISERLSLTSLDSDLSENGDFITLLFLPRLGDVLKMLPKLASDINMMHKH